MSLLDNVSEPSCTRLGVGLVYSSTLGPIFDGDDAPAVLELEPQTLWELVRDDGIWRYRMPPDRLAHIASYRPTKLVHGVGQPFATAAPDPVDDIPLLRVVVDALDPPWVSEHLSFNRATVGGRVRHAGFLLPPHQTKQTVRVAAMRIEAYRRATARPVAFETGVNYLARGGDELDDASFIRDVADASGAGILLDLHNLWCNHVNGRIDLFEVVERIPLDRVWEMHLAGGDVLGGYRLDSHRGPIPDELLHVAAEVMPRLPQLRALLYEVVGDELGDEGLDSVRLQLARLHDLWDLLPPIDVGPRSACNTRNPRPATPDDIDAVAAWENAMYAAITGTPTDGVFPELATDAGIAIYRRLVRDARLGSLARTMRYTMLLLLIHLGARATHNLLDAYLASCAPQLYPALEATQCCDYLQTALVEQRGIVATAVPYLGEVLGFEAALLRAAVFGEERRIEWTVDPAALFAALDEGRSPGHLPPVPQQMVVRV